MSNNSNQTLIQIENLVKTYNVKVVTDDKFKNLLGLRDTKKVNALNGVSFSLEKAKILAVVGESGCGKSTLARQLALIEQSDSGSYFFNGVNVAGSSSEEKRNIRSNIQMVFQNPYASLNPRKNIGHTLSTPLGIRYPELTESDIKDRVYKMLNSVGLSKEYYERYPHMLSGGQRQRIAIARALIINPNLIIADEPVSALDVSIQAQILNIMLNLQEQYQFSCVFISHDLHVVRFIANDIIIMYLGKIVETGNAEDVFKQPLHPYTKFLISATPSLHSKTEKIKVEGELPSPLNIPPGCSFHQRCPFANEQCKVEVPELKDFRGRKVACIRAEEVN